MIFNISVFCVSSLLLLHLAGAKPVSSLQTLKQLLDEEINAPLVESQESAMEQAEARTEERQLNPDQQVRTSTALERVLGDLLSTSKRSWSRFKKGGLRSCFGVRLERIGSFSGLGC
ncbi:natriuretic peptide A-like [Paramisgurnus dabryanus]|uniref:natriuretic peptide A-like n=1 Tax=Paramisgurnus dabryanus TaxID=90735 RepID=UPI0031F46725